MNEKLQKMCEEILQDENESKKFIAIQTPEEMYDYFKEKMPELTEDEFDSFITEALDSYASMQQQEPESVSDMLDKVSGGVNFGKFSKQMVASAMAALSLGSAAMAANTQPAPAGGNTSAVVVQNATKPTGKFKKFTNWVKNHKALSTVIGAGVLVGSAVGIKYGVDYFKNRNKQEEHKGSEQSSKLDIKKIAQQIYTDTTLVKEASVESHVKVKTFGAILAKSYDKLYGYFRQLHDSLLGINQNLQWNLDTHTVTLEPASNGPRPTKAALDKMAKKIDPIIKAIKDVGFATPQSDAGYVPRMVEMWLNAHRDIKEQLNSGDVHAIEKEIIELSGSDTLKKISSINDFKTELMVIDLKVKGIKSLEEASAIKQ